MMDAEKQIRSFENRSKGLKKKLWELSTLCDVEVCMVCTRPSSSQLHVWPEDRSKVEQMITKYRMTMKSSCGNKKKKVVHSVLDINVGGLKKEVQVLDEQHLNFLGKDQGKTKEEIFLESLPYEKLKEFMSALNGKIEKVKQEIALKKMQAELMELMYGDGTISPTPKGENENVEAASCSSTYDDHQKMMVPVPPMQEMVHRMPQNHLIATVPDPMQNMMWMPAHLNHLTAVPPMKHMMCMPQNHLTPNPSMQEMVCRMPQPLLTAIPSMQNIMWMPENQLTAAIPAIPEVMLMSQNRHHVAYSGNYSGNYSNQYGRDVHAFNF